MVHRARAAEASRQINELKQWIALSTMGPLRTSAIAECQHFRRGMAGS